MYFNENDAEKAANELNGTKIDSMVMKASISD